MKLLLDECVTHDLVPDLVGHEVHTVEDAGLKGLRNGDLLRAATGVYEVLITVDRKIPYQQSVSGLPIAILILAAKKEQLCAPEATLAARVGSARNNQAWRGR